MGFACRGCKNLAAWKANSVVLLPLRTNCFLYFLHTGHFGPLPPIRCSFFFGRGFKGIVYCASNFKCVTSILCKKSRSAPFQVTTPALRLWLSFPVSTLTRNPHLKSPFLRTYFQPLFRRNNVPFGAFLPRRTRAAVAHIKYVITAQGTVILPPPVIAAGTRVFPVHSGSSSSFTAMACTTARGGNATGSASGFGFPFHESLLLPCFRTGDCRHCPSARRNPLPHKLGAV